MYCSKCGKELADGAKFCPQCGAKVNTITPSDNNTPSQTDARAAANAAVENASKFMSNMLDKGAKNAKVLAEKATPALKGLAEQAKAASEQAIVVAGELKEEAAKKVNEIQEKRAQQQQDALQEDGETQGWSAKNYSLWKSLLLKIPSFGNILQRIFHPLPNIVKYGCAWYCTFCVGCFLLGGIVSVFSDGDSSTSSVAYEAAYEEQGGEQEEAAPVQKQRQSPAYRFTNETGVLGNLCLYPFKAPNGSIDFQTMGQELNMDGQLFRGASEVQILNEYTAIIFFRSPGMNTKFVLNALEGGKFELTTELGDTYTTN